MLFGNVCKRFGLQRCGRVLRSGWHGFSLCCPSVELVTYRTLDNAEQILFLRFFSAKAHRTMPLKRPLTSAIPWV